MNYPIDEYGRNWEERVAYSVPTRSPCPSPSNLPEHPEIGVEHYWNPGMIKRRETFPREAEGSSQPKSNKTFSGFGLFGSSVGTKSDADSAFCGSSGRFGVPSSSFETVEEQSDEEDELSVSFPPKDKQVQNDFNRMQLDRLGARSLTETPEEKVVRLAEKDKKKKEHDKLLAKAQERQRARYEHMDMDPIPASLAYLRDSDDTVMKIDLMSYEINDAFFD